MLKRMKNYISIVDSASESSKDSDDDYHDSDNEGKTFNSKVNINNTNQLNTINDTNNINENNNFNYEADNTKTNEEDTTSIYHCNICLKKLISFNDYDSHIKSKKHKTKFNLDLKRQVKSTKGIKKFLIQKGFITKVKSRLNKIKYYLYRDSLRKMIK